MLGVGVKKGLKRSSWLVEGGVLDCDSGFSYAQGAEPSLAPMARIIGKPLKGKEPEKNIVVHRYMDKGGLSKDDRVSIFGIIVSSYSSFHILVLRMHRSNRMWRH